MWTNNSVKEVSKNIWGKKEYFNLLPVKSFFVADSTQQADDRSWRKPFSSQYAPSSHSFYQNFAYHNNTSGICAVEKYIRKIIKLIIRKTGADDRVCLVVV